MHGMNAGGRKRGAWKGSMRARSRMRLEDWRVAREEILPCSSTYTMPTHSPTRFPRIASSLHRHIMRSRKSVFTFCCGMPRATL